MAPSRAGGTTAIPPTFASISATTRSSLRTANCRLMRMEPPNTLSRRTIPWPLSRSVTRRYSASSSTLTERRRIAPISPSDTVRQPSGIPGLGQPLRQLLLSLVKRLLGLHELCEGGLDGDDLGGGALDVAAD